MGAAKQVKFYNGRYCGNLGETDCMQLESIIEKNNDNSYFAELRHIIYHMSDSDVATVIEDTESVGCLVHEVEYPRGKLRDDQTVGVAFLVTAKRCILGDSTGMGKTVEVAGAVRYISAELEKQGEAMRYLVLTEKGAASHQFRNEMIKFTGEYVGLIPSGCASDMAAFRERFPYTEALPCSLVGTHSLLTTPSFIQWLELCRTQGEGFPFDTLIVDESSVLGGTKTQVVNSFKAISKYFNNIFFLNATPFETNLGTFYNQLNLVDPSLLPTKTNFDREFCIIDYRGMYPRKTGKYKNQGQFKYLVGYRYFARTRKSKGAVMEGCDGGVILSPLSPIQKEWLAKSQLYNIVYDCPNHLDPSIEFCIENIPKLGSLKSLLENECLDADTILIFAHYKAVQKYLSKWLQERGYSNRVLNGDTKASDRQEIATGFRNKEFRVLITSVQKSLNFGDCNHCILYSYDSNPSAMVQFEGRITRDFDIVGKHIYILCSEGKEYKVLNEVVRERAKAASEFTEMDLSIILRILIGDD